LQSQNVNHYGALLLCAAISKVFPREQICFSDANGRGFSVEFTYSEPFQEAYLAMLEKAMKDFSKEEIALREMVASNAKELLMHKGHSKWADCLQGGTVFVAEIGGFWGLCTGEIEQCDYFSLLHFDQEKRRVTIEGMAFESSEDQKSFLKKYRQYPKKNFEFLAEELDLVDEGIWQRRGMALRRVLVDYWRKGLEAEGFYEISEPDLRKKKFSCWNGAEDRSYCFGACRQLPNLLNSSSFPLGDDRESGVILANMTPDSLSPPREKIISNSAIRQLTTGPNEDCLISSLQFIQKWVNIFNFESMWVLVKPTKNIKQAMATCGMDFVCEEGEQTQVELRIADALGRYWTGPTLWLKRQGIEFSLFGNLERFIGLLLERFEGELPFWLAPEQVRLLPMEGVELEPVIKIFERQKVRFFIDAEPVLLKEKMHRALRAKVPYVMVFGKREENSKQMNIRTYGSSSDERMTMEELEQFLAERKLENQ